MVIEGILQESRQLYIQQYHQLVGLLIHIPKGSLRKVRRGGKSYWYLRRYTAERGYEDVYIGSLENKETDALVKFVGQRKKRLEEIKAVRQALKSLGVKKMESKKQGYDQLLVSLIEAFGEAGLWEEGLMLIGSWCFSVYVQAFDVEYYPLRTMDFDFGLRIPYTGDKVDIDGLLKNLGFTDQIDPGHDKIDYVLPGVGTVEVFIDRESASKEQILKLKQELSLRPAALSHLHILVNNPVTTNVHGVHQAITIPSMPAFFIHRLITAAFGEYRDPVLNVHKVRKDYKQAALIAKKILFNNALRHELDQIIQKLSDDLCQKALQGAQAAEKFIRAPDLLEEDISYILKLSTTL
jgi:hypothetical protein